MKRKWLRWALILPVGELLLAGVVAGLPAVRILTLAKSRPIQRVRTDGKIILNVPPELEENWLSEDGRRRFPDRFEAIWYLNFPGMLGEIAISLPTTWPESYQPGWAWPIGFEGFRALSWPFWALPFWWLAGRGIDAFVASLSESNSCIIRWYEAWGMALFGSLIFIVGTVVTLMINPHYDPPEMRWLHLPIAMWFVFGLMPLLAWIRQRRARSQGETPATTR